MIPQKVPTKNAEECQKVLKLLQTAKNCNNKKINYRAKKNIAKQFKNMSEDQNSPEQVSKR